MKITFTLPTEQDCIDMGGINLDGRIKLTAVDGDKTAYTYMKIEDYNRLGIEYISKNIQLEYSSFCDEWFIKVSKDNYRNDTARNPEKTIELNFISTYTGTGAELYRDIESGKYWLRYVSDREDFAKWLVCGVRKPQNDDGNEPRPNITLKHNGQTEKLTYRDWNGTCAYSDTFNRNFNKITKE